MPEALTPEQREAKMLEALKIAEVWLANCIPIGKPTTHEPLPIIRAAIARTEGKVK
jgi:hypothetical protein